MRLNVVGFFQVKGLCQQTHTFNEEIERCSNENQPNCCNRGSPNWAYVPAKSWRLFARYAIQYITLYSIL